MASKDFKVKNGLSVGQSITVNQNINVVGEVRSLDSSGNETVIISRTGEYSGKYAGFDSDFQVRFGSVTTDSLSEGLSNLYYTSTRFDSDLSTKTTTDLTEGDNLYYTQARFDSALANKTTTDLTEGDNLYYTQARFDSALANKTTTDLTEGDNLYYTDSRVETYLTVNNYAKISDIDSAISALIDAAPEQLDTLNELAAAINDDSDFAGTITGLIGQKLAKNEFSTYFDSNFALKTTNDLTEGDNLYYTSARVDSDILSLVDSSYIELRRPPEAIFEVTNNVASAYTFIGDGFPSASDNPSLYLQRGMTYKFKLNATGHPFEIRTSDGGSAYSTGVINNSVETGDIYFTVPMDAPDTLYYQCTIHSVMGGTIYVTEASSITTDKVTEGVLNLYYTSSRVDSDILSLVDSSYIQLRQADIFRDSGFVTGIIDSSYINARVVIPEAGIDSSAVTSIIDSAYINARVDTISGSGGAVNLNDLLDVDTTGAVSGSVLKYNGASWVIGVDNTGSGGSGTGTVDSAQTIQLITDTVDSAYISARVSGGDGTAVYYLSDVYYQNYQYISESNQSVFTGVDEYGNTLNVDSNDIQVYVNGVRINQSDYTLLNNTITLVTGLSNNDEVVVTSIKRAEDNVAFTAGVDTFYFIATQDQTVFSGSDQNAVTLDYSPGSIQVYLNGILLIDGTDYTATNGTSITLTDAANSGDEFYIVSHIPSNIYTIQNLVDSDYINARVVIPDAGIDSASVTAIIDSDYINARVVIPQAYGDSDVIQLVDSAYVSSRFDLSALGEGEVSSYIFTADSGQTDFSGQDDNGNTLTYSEGQLQLFLNGVLLVNSLDYTATDGTTVSLIEAADSADQLVVNTFSAYFSSLTQSYVYVGNSYFEEYEFIAESGQAVFTGLDVNNNTLAFDSDNYIVYMNGFKLTDSDYTANPVTDTITLSPPASLSDEITVIVLENKSTNVTFDNDIRSGIDALVSNSVDSYAALVFDSDYIQSRLTFDLAQSTYEFYRYVATSGQTTFSGIDDLGQTLSYNPNNITIYYNGSLLTNSIDYNANDGSSVVLTLGADSGDEISIIEYNQLFIADVDSATVTGIIDSDYINARIRSWEEATTNITVEAGQKLIVDTSSTAITVTLPSVATLGDEVRIIDGAGNAATNNITINRNGHNIQGVADNLTIDLDRAAFGLVYYNSSNGWVLTEK